MKKRWMSTLTAVTAALTIWAGSLNVCQAATPEELGTKYPNLDGDKWSLCWSDEFDGTALDTGKWNYTVGGGGFGNNEQQYYTSNAENVRLENGMLVIQAVPGSYGGENYTSAKLTTLGKADWTYGKFEFRAKLPKGQGLWPAIWMLPSDSDVYGGEWPISGEIDIMEYKGSEPNTALGTLHYGNPWVYNTGYYYLNGTESFADDFHTFSMEWLPGEFRWYVDGNLYQIQKDWYSVDTDGTQYAYPAPFDRDFYLMLNLAVGGFFPGDPDTSTWTADTFEIDYVRVYEYTGNYEEAAGQGQIPFVNLLTNSGFDNGMDGWTAWTENGSVFQVEDGALKADIYTTLPNTWSTQLYQNAEIVTGTAYRLDFDMKGTMERPVTVGLEGAGNASLFARTVTAGTQWQHYSFDFVPLSGCSNAKLLFFLGNVDGAVNSAHSLYFDNITLMPVTEEERVVNGDFDGNLDGWTTWTENGSVYSYDSTLGCFSAYMPTVLPNAWSSQLYQNIDASATGTYTICFDIKSSIARQITVALEKEGVSPALNQTVNVTDTWSTQRFTFTGGSAFSGAKLVFMLGNVGDTANTAHTVQIDNVSVVKNP